MSAHGERTIFLATLRRRVAYRSFPHRSAELFGYARFTLSPELLAHSSYPGMYAAVGSIVVILIVRLASLVKMILEDYRNKR